MASSTLHTAHHDPGAMRTMSRDNDIERAGTTTTGYNYLEEAELHQAEEPPLQWSDEQGTWRAPDDSQVIDNTSHSSDNVTTAVSTQLPHSEDRQSGNSSSQASVSSDARQAEEAGQAAGQGARPLRQLSAASGPIYVQFDDNDPENPFEWSARRKWTLTLVGSWLTTLVAIAGPGYVMGVPQLQRELGISHIVAALSFSLYPLGFGLGPLVLAPISEVYGRNPMYLGSTVLFTLFYLPLALGKDIALISVFRFLSGVAGSVGSTMVGGTIADIWVARERGKPMAIFSIGAFAGTGLGPAMFGYVAQTIGWRWIEWIEMIMAGATSLLVILLFRETRGSVILSKRAAKLRKETGLDYRCRADEERASLAVLIKTGISRPLWFLISEPIVLSLSIFVGFAWGCLYGLVEAIPLVYGNVYGWRIGAQGLAFIPIALGGLLGYGANVLQERAYRRLHPVKGMEARLYGSLFGGILFAVGSMIFAWAIKGFWVGPFFGLAILIFGIYFIYQAVFTYLADAYTVYASSAMSAQSFARNLMGFVFPLFTTQMYEQLGYSWASFLFSMIAFLLSVIPFVLYKYGERIRARSPAAIELARQMEEFERKVAERKAARERKKAALAGNSQDQPAASSQEEKAAAAKVQ